MKRDAMPKSMRRPPNRRGLRRRCWKKILPVLVIVGYFAFQVFLFRLYVMPTAMSTSATAQEITVLVTERTQPKTRTSSSRRTRTNGQLAPLLIVGGSDGSGTRAVVEMLRELGTTMVSEDNRTFDVHAWEIERGWPGLIEDIFLPFGRGGFYSTRRRVSRNFDANSASNTSTGSTDMGTLVENFDWPPDNSNQGNEEDIATVEADIETLLVSWDSKYSRQMSIRRRERRKQQQIPHHKAAAAKISWGVKHTKKVPGSRAYDEGRTTVMFPNATASGVSYAIKAPASMLALPVIAACYFSLKRKEQQQQQQQRNQPYHNPPPRPLKFLHVVRDGRDVALSNNQSPVIKFYDLTYPKQFREQGPHRSRFSAPSLMPPTEQRDQMYARAMQLWNDWNVAVHRWATNDTRNINRAVPQIESDDRVPLVDYLWIRSEDLLIPGSRERLESLTTIAKFVGSSLTSEELCCLNWQAVKDNGESHSTRNKTVTPPIQIATTNNRRRPTAEPMRSDGNPSTLKKRYGKWHAILAKKPELLEFFQREGAEGLELFGYHPSRRIRYMAQNCDGEKTGKDARHGKKDSTKTGRNIPDEAEIADASSCQLSVACPRAVSIP